MLNRKQVKRSALKKIALSSLSKGLRAQILKELRTPVLAKSSELESCLKAIAAVNEFIDENIRHYEGRDWFAVNMKIYDLPDAGDYDGKIDDDTFYERWTDFCAQTFEAFTESFEEKWAATPALAALTSGTAPKHGAAGRSNGWFVIDVKSLKAPFDRYDLEDLQDLPEAARLKLTMDQLEDDFGLTKEDLSAVQNYAEALLTFLKDNQQTVKDVVSNLPKEFKETIEESLTN